jgi:hypothetical protein
LQRAPETGKAWQASRPIYVLPFQLCTPAATSCFQQVFRGKSAVRGLTICGPIFAQHRVFLRRLPTDRPLGALLCWESEVRLRGQIRRTSDPDQDGARRDRPSHVFRIDAAGAVHRQIRGRRAEQFKEPAGARTAGCSTAVVMMCSPLCFSAKKVPLMARLLASLPPLVNTISSGAAPSSAATWPRAYSRATLAGTLAQ